MCGNFLATPQCEFESFIDEAVQSSDDGFVYGVLRLCSFWWCPSLGDLWTRDCRDVIEQEGPAWLSSVEC